MLEDLIRTTGVVMSGSGALWATVAPDPSNGPLFAWLGAALTFGSIAYPKLKALYLDWRKTESEQDLNETNAYREMLLEHQKQTLAENAELVRQNMELKAKVDLLSKQVEELTARIEAFSAVVVNKVNEHSSRIMEIENV